MRNVMIIWAYSFLIYKDGIDYGIREPWECITQGGEEGGRMEGYNISEGNSGICNPDRNAGARESPPSAVGSMEILYISMKTE